MSGSYRTLIEKNVCKFSEYTGIYIVGSGYSNILDNNLTSSGFNWYVSQNLEYDLTMSFENNYVNDKPFVFLTNLTNQTLSSNDFGQLFLMNCSDITIEDLDIRDTSTALSLAFCRNSTIRNSNFSENTVSGISLDYSTDIVFSNNNCSDNISETTGFNYQDCYGIQLYESTLVTIQNNTFLRNKRNGINLFVCDNCSIIYNRIEVNRHRGIFIWASRNNSIHHNSFIDNTQYLDANSQAYDADGSNNFFYDAHVNQGNYWSDWISGHYSIDGTSAYSSTDPYTHRDPYPLLSPPV